MALDDRCALDDGIPHQQVAGAMVNMYRMTEEFGKPPVDLVPTLLAAGGPLL